jgi:hypothetical protein
MDQSNDPRYNFDANPTVDELIAQQGKGPVNDPKILLGDFWPEDEPIEDFLAALHDWRGHKKVDLLA